ncbi:MAG: hypothetical protein U0Q12_16700 [Vicinamibacterales bacterium]
MTKMWATPCTQEEAVRRATSAGEWPADLRAHVDGCADCQDTLAVIETLRTFAAAEADAARPPDAARIWWKAQLLQRWDAETRVTSAVDTMQRFEIGVGLVASLGLVVWQWPALARGLGLVQATTPSGPWTLPALAMLGSGLAAAMVAAIVVTMFPERQ